MGLIQDDLKKDYFKRERKRSFGEFVKAQPKGMSGAALMNDGLHDSYGPVKFRHELRGNAWVLDAGAYPNLLLFDKEADAKGYAKELKEILKKEGRGASQVWVQRVVLRSEKPYASFKLKKAAVSYDAGDRFIIRMDVH